MTSPERTGLPQEGVEAAAFRLDTDFLAVTDSLDAIPALNEVYLGYLTRSLCTTETAEPQTCSR